MKLNKIFELGNVLHYPENYLSNGIYDYYKI